MKEEGQEEKVTPSVHKAEVKFLTVAFWDIRGFSKLCDILRASSIPETLPNGTLRASRIPDTLVEFLTEYYDSVEDAVTSNRGVVDKFIGDGVMARFGVRGHDNKDGTNDDAISAVSAALQLRESFREIKSRWLDRWKKDINEELDISLKCGINTGPVIVAEVGTKHSQYTALGSVVNYASRFAGLAGYAKDTDILISQTTQSRVKDNYLVAREPTPIDNLMKPKSFGNVKGVYPVLRRTRV
jgi:class 3 adenylate cyclase